MRKFNICFLILLFGLIILASNIAYGAEAEYNFRMGGSAPVGDVIDLTNKHFVDLITEKSDGRVKIVFYPAAQLGSDLAQIESVISGSQDLFGGGIDWLSHWEKDFGILGYGFLFRDADQKLKFLKSPLFEEIKESFESQIGAKIVGTPIPLGRRILFSKKPIFKIEDIQGVKMRVPEVETILATWTAIGTNPTRVTWTEIYMGLMQGIVDATEGPIASVYQEKFYEVAPYAIYTNHWITEHFFLMSGNAWNNLPQDLQKIFADAAVEAGLWGYENFNEMEKEFINKMLEEGVVFIQIDLKPWSDKALSGAVALEEKGLWSKGLLKKTQEEIK